MTVGPSGSLVCPLDSYGLDSLASRARTSPSVSQTQKVFERLLGQAARGLMWKGNRIDMRTHDANVEDSFTLCLLRHRIPSHVHSYAFSPSNSPLPMCSCLAFAFSLRYPSIHHLFAFFILFTTTTTLPYLP